MREVTMEIQNKIDSLLQSQKETLKQYEELIKELNIENAVGESLALREEVARCKESIQELKTQQAKLMDENMHIKISLKEQMLHEKVSILNGSKGKIELYFKDEINKSMNKLQALEALAKQKLSRMKSVAEKELKEEKEGLLLQITMMEGELAEKLKHRRAILEREKESILDELKREYDELRNQGVSEEVIQQKKKYNDIEVKIGLNWINKAGIILLLLGMATAMKYTYATWFNAYMKGISGFLFGGILLGAGEWLNRKEKNLFALGLTGGGIGVLYLSVFSGYFILDILSMPISILISILVTGASLILAQRYKSMTVCGISLVGGYLPFFSYVFIEGISGSQFYIAMGYLFVLNLLVLGLSVGRRWIYINYLSFLLHVPCMIYLAFEAPNKILGIAYAILAFMMYLAITLIYPVRENVKLKKVDVVLLGLNTAINCILVYGLFESAGYDDFKGILALIYGAIYLLLGQWIHKSATQEKDTQALFYITAMTFSILMIPFQFGMEWASLGWLVEGILLITYGNRILAKKMELAGWITLGLCVAGFMIMDFPEFWGTQHFVLKYTLITLGLLYVLSQYFKDFVQNPLFGHSRRGKFLHVYKYFTIIHTWIYLIRMTGKGYEKYVQTYDYGNFYQVMSVALVTAIFAYGISKVPAIQDKIVSGISIGLYIVADLIGFSANFIPAGLYMETGPKVIPVVILVLYNVFIFFSLKDLILRGIRYKGLSLEAYPIVLAVYILGAASVFMINQFDLGDINLIISIFFVVMSGVYITYGFKKGFVLMRRFGLGLSIFSTGKLFIFDLVFLNTLGRIAGYFCFGLVLIAISYVYHRLSSSLEAKGDHSA